MSERRTARVASMIREVVSETILKELRDPRIRNVTVLGAEVSPDLRYAKIRVSVRGDEKQAALTMHGLNSARGFLQSKVADYIRTRYTPELRFLLDSGLEKSFETTRILNELKLEESGTEESTVSTAEAESSPAEDASRIDEPDAPEDDSHQSGPSATD